MSSAFKCDICGEFFEYEPPVTMTKRGKWAVNDDGSVNIYMTSYYFDESEMEFCQTCTKEVAAFIFDKRMKKAET